LGQVGDHGRGDLDEMVISAARVGAEQDERLVGADPVG
jgi:hypothetical protein